MTTSITGRLTQGTPFSAATPETTQEEFAEFCSVSGHDQVHCFVFFFYLGAKGVIKGSENILDT